MSTSLLKLTSLWCNDDVGNWELLLWSWAWRNEDTHDQGPQVTSQVWKSFCQLVGAYVSLSSRSNPQTNCPTEWAKQDLEAVPRCISASNSSSWSAHLAWVEYAHNSQQLCYQHGPLQKVPEIPATTVLSPWGWPWGILSLTSPPSLPWGLERCLFLTWG